MRAVVAKPFSVACGAVLTLVHQILNSDDIDSIYSFCEIRLAERMSDDVEARFVSWGAKWRRESLEYYLKMGWSFVVREGSHEGQVCGFFLSQPLLFFRGQTQSLWVEYIDGETPEATASLVEVAVKLGREKHLQRVLFAEADKIEEHLKVWNPSYLSDSGERIAIVKTTKG